jgi:hypothetical protein
MNILIILILSSVVSTQDSSDIGNKINLQRHQMSSQRYHADKDGNILMFINVLGHVNSPGNHLVYDGIDLVTLLSIVGGPKKGAKLKKVRLFREIPDENGMISYELDLNDFFKNGVRDNLIEVKPNDTIIFTETHTSYILSQIGSVSTFLQIINLYFQLASK